MSNDQKSPPPRYHNSFDQQTTKCLESCHARVETGDITYTTHIQWFDCRIEVVLTCFFLVAVVTLVLINVRCGCFVVVSSIGLCTICFANFRTRIGCDIKRSNAKGHCVLHNNSTVSFLQSFIY